MKKSVKFGVFADLHNTLVPHPAQRVADFLDCCKKEEVDFIVQLGDFILPENFPYLACRDYSENEIVLKMLHEFGKPFYNVLGNHDCQGIDKKDILKYWRTNTQPYFSFDVNRFHFVVLDCNFWKYEGDIIPFDKNFFAIRKTVTDKGMKHDLPYISGEQIKWLEEDLAKTEYPTVLFSHQRLCPDNSESIHNAEELRKVIEDAPCKVVLSINGHEHIDNAAQKNNIWYYSMNSMSNCWLGEKFAFQGKMGVETDEIFPFLKCVVPYDKAVFSIVTLDEKGADIKGRKADFIGPTPRELGAYDEGSRFLTDFDCEITACAEDRYLPFE